MVYVTDPIGDLLTRMRNAQSAQHTQCRAPWSRVNEQLCTLLQKEGWVADVNVEGEGIEKEVVVSFSPEKEKLELTRVSKPGRRVYSGYQELRPVLHGYGIAVITTSQGLMTDKQAREQKIGGEVLCTVA